MSSPENWISPSPEAEVRDRIALRAHSIKARRRLVRTSAAGASLAAVLAAVSAVIPGAGGPSLLRTTPADSTATTIRHEIEGQGASAEISGDVDPTTTPAHGGAQVRAAHGTGGAKGAAGLHQSDAMTASPWFRDASGDANTQVTVACVDQSCTDPNGAGGSEPSADLISGRLAWRGHEVTAFTELLNLSEPLHESRSGDSRQLVYSFHVALHEPGERAVWVLLKARLDVDTRAVVYTAVARREVCASTGASDHCSWDDRVLPAAGTWDEATNTVSVTADSRAINAELHAAGTSRSLGEHSIKGVQGTTELVSPVSEGAATIIPLDFAQSS